MASPAQWHGYSVILGAGDWIVGPGELFRWTVSGDAVGLCGLETVSVRLLPPGGGEYEATSLPGTTIAVGGPSGVPTDLPAVAALSLTPNPFNPLTYVAWEGAGAQAGQLEVYNLRGQRVVRLWQGVLSTGKAIPWDGRDATGRDAPSGVYTFLLTGSDGAAITTRGTLLR